MLLKKLQDIIFLDLNALQKKTACNITGVLYLGCILGWSTPAAITIAVDKAIEVL